MQPFRPAAVQVSDIAYPLPWWRYALIFQSWDQATSYVLMVGGFAAAILALGAIDSGGHFPYQLIFFSGIAGSCLSLFMVMPVTFHVSPASAETNRRIHADLADLRYVELQNDGDSTTYRQNLPRLLRWDVANITVRRTRDGFVVSGPRFALKAVRNTLSRAPGRVKQA